MADESWRERKREYQRRYLERHPKKRKESCKKYNAKPEVKERMAVWKEKNSIRYLASKYKYYEKNKEHIFLQAREFARMHPAWKAAHCAKRRATKKQAIPSWVDWDLVKDMYLEAEYQGLVVDHIIPLTSKTVCGLHWEGNLQLLTPSQNSTKNNSYES